MKLQFVSTPTSMTSIRGDATSWHVVMPRPVRKLLRLHSPTARTNTHDGVDSYMALEYRRHDYFGTNLVDPDMDIDGSVEFGDCTGDDLAGLTIVETASETELFAFCTGYEV